MNIRKILINIVTLSMACSSTAFSGAIIPVPESKLEKEVFINYGLSQINQNQSVLLNSASGLTNHYKSDSNQAGTIMLGFGLSKQYKVLDNGAKVYFGIDVAYLNHNTFSGTISPVTNLAPNISRLRYHYQLDSGVVLLNAKIVKDKVFKSWNGYAKASIGGAYKYLSKSYLVFCPDCFQNVI